jgi:hypothetical protein
MRALECMDSIMETTSGADGTGVRSVMTTIIKYGSVCFKSQYCKVYNEYGSCSTCHDGFFYDTDKLCKPCM